MLIVGMTLCSSIAVFLLWALSTLKASLLVFSIVFRTFVGKYSTLFPRFAALLVESGECPNPGGRASRLN